MLMVLEMTAVIPPSIRLDMLIIVHWTHWVSSIFFLSLIKPMATMTTQPIRDIIFAITKVVFKLIFPSFIISCLAQTKNNSISKIFFKWLFRCWPLRCDKMDNGFQGKEIL